MFIIFLKLSDKDRVSAHLVGHKAWLERGFDDGVFLLAGNLSPQMGGRLIAHNITLEDLQERVAEDPFVAQNIVTVEIIELSVSRADERLAFLVN